jgi:hypothetical protein
VEWCNKVFGFMVAECGHLEVEIPPGCYIVWALQLVWLPPPAKFPLFRATHFAIVMVECEQSACVHLYFPTARQSNRDSANAARILAEEGAVPRKKAEALLDAANALLEHLPKTGHDEAAERAVQEAAAKAKRKRK